MDNGALPSIGQLEEDIIAVVATRDGTHGSAVE
jgi:hypothetical protein